MNETEKTVIKKIQKLQEIARKSGPHYPNISVKITDISYEIIHYLYSSWDDRWIPSVWLPPEMAKEINWIEKQKPCHNFLIAWIKLNQK